MVGGYIYGVGDLHGSISGSVVGVSHILPGGLIPSTTSAQVGTLNIFGSFSGAEVDVVGKLDLFYLILSKNERNNI